MRLKTMVDYLGGKKNILQAKINKALWHDQKVREHTDLAVKVRAQVEEYRVVVDIIEKLEAGIETHRQEIASAKELSKQGTVDLEETLAAIQVSEDGISDKLSRIRALFYA